MATSLLPASWQVPEKFRKRLGNDVGRQRAMQHEDHLLLVLHAPPKPDDDHRVGRFFWRRPDGQWTSKDLGSGTQALLRHLEEYEELIVRLDDQQEAATTSDEYFGVLSKLAPIHRTARNLHAVLQEARRLCPDDGDIINMRDRAYAIERNAELLYEETKNALDFAMARRMEEQAESTRYMAVTSHRLNMLVAFFFPIATLTAIFGINLEHGYERRHAPYLFLTTIGIGLLLGVFLTAIVRQRRSSRRGT